MKNKVPALDFNNASAEEIKKYIADERKKLRLDELDHSMGTEVIHSVI